MGTANARAGGSAGRARFLVTGALALPVVTFVLLRLFPSRDTAVGSPTGHFLVVSAVSALAFTLAVAVAWAARHLPDARTFALAMGFLSMAGVFLAHGAGTGPFAHDAHAPPAVHAVHQESRDSGTGDGYGPRGPAERAYDQSPAVAVASGSSGAPVAVPADAYTADAYAVDAYATYAPASGPSAVAPHAAPTPVTVARAQTVGFSARLSLMVSALWFALAVVDLRRRAADLIVRHWTALAAAVTGALVAYGVTALGSPTRLSALPMTATGVSWGVATVTWMALAFAGWRFWQAYRLAALALQGTMALSMVLLMEAQWFMLRGPVWQLSWWEYHATMLVGFLAPVAALLWQYRTAGDLGVVVEGLFLRATVTGLRQGDPQALAALAVAVAAKDSETEEHTTRVGALALAIGCRLELPRERQELLRWAGRLHDLGKIGVPNRILRKPGPLTPAEFAVMQQHSARGGRVAQRAGRLAPAAPIIRAHHERLDGSGYPDGLRGEAIPLEARIIAVADVWDALTCDRPYRAAMPVAQAAAIVRAESGPKLDARCVAALFAELRAAGGTQLPAA